VAAGAVVATGAVVAAGAVVATGAVVAAGIAAVAVAAGPQPDSANAAIMSTANRLYIYFFDIFSSPCI
jgi:tetrahydrodipicolinate N-succinyltransferase